MKYRLAIVGLLLWGATLATAVFLFFHGTTTTGSDGRSVVIITKAERDQILQEMRGMLQATADITGALAAGNNAAIASPALSVGAAAMSADSPVLLAKLPLGLKEAGLAVHNGFDALAGAAKSGASKDRLTAMISDQLTICAGCHAQYRFSE